MQERIATPDLRQVHRLLNKHAIPDDLVVVRFSSRAKRLIFKSSVVKGVEIVVPHRAGLSWVAEMVENRIPWIKSAEQHVKEGRSQLNPRHIDLKSLGEIWSVDYSPVDEVAKGLVINGEYTLTVGVDPKDVFGAARKLQRWFHQKARASLVPWLISIAEGRGLKFNRTFVKNQVSLWGSCSQKRNINLNRNLLFLPEHLVEYVLHHELTHLEHLDHSGRFWSSFTKALPDCTELRREMRSLNPEDIPLWASPGLDSV
jgi:predicted metal-dependent hydrolase